jgi:hypothetical protein
MMMCSMEGFEDAVSRQNFSFLAREAQSNSLVSMVQGRLSDGAFRARQAGRTLKDAQQKLD